MTFPVICYVDTLLLHSFVDYYIVVDAYVVRYSITIVTLLIDHVTLLRSLCGALHYVPDFPLIHYRCAYVPDLFAICR